MRSDFSGYLVVGEHHVMTVEIIGVNRVAVPDIAAAEARDLHLYDAVGNGYGKTISDFRLHRTAS